MRIIFSLLSALILSLCSLSVFALQVTLQSDETDPIVMVSNEAELNAVDIYLVVFDKDAKDRQPVFQSWIADQGWQMGLKPLSSSAIDLIPFESRELTTLTTTCPDEHRCVLALVAIEHGLEPLANEDKWQAASFLPLTLSAGCERWPGQTFFLSCDQFSRVGGIELAVDDGAGADAPKAAPDASEAAGSSAPDTEKPDIFRLVGDKLLYANGQAKRFQVIDMTDISNPVLKSWVPLSGYPRELYVLGEHYVLLQTDYVGEEGTHLTVLREDEAGQLITVDEKTLSGHFIESRRRNDLIYSVTQDYKTEENQGDTEEEPVCLGCRFTTQILNIKVSRLTEAGKLEDAAETELTGYSPTIAIFPNHLVIANHNPAEEKWRTTQLQVFDLSQSDPLVELETLKVPGRVPSEFHLSIVDDQFRVVYGPEDREDGSSLAIYRLPKMSLIGKVDKIAPGEDLFATRFVGDRAFVVTFERTDPLWVIDLSEANAPKIIGELHVPGWSEKLFFHEDRLFAVGINDQPFEGEEERWVRRVALSLFDVTDPTKPSLINSLTPLAGEVNYSWSPAIDDERALLLNWEDAFAALPINSWESEAGNHLQIVSIDNDKLEEAGRLDSTVPIQRSIALEPDVLAALGDQALITLRWGEGETEKLAELELATNLAWLDLENEALLSAAMGNQGYHRFYRYAKTDLETPTKRWNLPRGYDGLSRAGDLVVFYDYNPLAVQMLDLNTGELKKVQALEKPAEPSGEADAKMATGTSMWYNRSQALFHNGHFYIAEQRQFQAKEVQASILPYPDPEQWQVQWLLRSWDIQTEEAKEAPIRSIPGQPLGLTANGELITQEVTEQGLLRLNLSQLDAEQARLLQSRDLPCQAYSQVMWANEAVYISCQKEQNYMPEPIILEDDVLEDEKKADEKKADEKKADEKKAETEETGDSQEQTPTTRLLKLNPGQGFTEEGAWTMNGFRRLQAIQSDIVLMGAGYGWYGPWMATDMLMRSGQRSQATDYESGCDIYQLLPEQEPVLLKHLDSCPYGEQSIVLTPNQAWKVEGYVGISEINWP
jgi:hypothetical protein